QRTLIEGELPQVLLLVVEPPEPGRLAVEPAGADAVELDEVAVHVWLHHRARHAAAGHDGEGGCGSVRIPPVDPVPLLRIPPTAVLGRSARSPATAWGPAPRSPEALTRRLGTKATPASANWVIMRSR